MGSILRMSAYGKPPVSDPHALTWYSAEVERSKGSKTHRFLSKDEVHLRIVRVRFERVEGLGGHPNDDGFLRCCMHGISGLGDGLEMYGAVWQRHLDLYTTKDVKRSTVNATGDLGGKYSRWLFPV
jgi:hypothetical protein